MKRGMNPAHELRDSEFAQQRRKCIVARYSCAWRRRCARLRAAPPETTPTARPTARSAWPCRWRRAAGPPRSTLWAPSSAASAPGDPRSVPPARAASLQRPLTRALPAMAPRQHATLSVHFDGPGRCETRPRARREPERGGSAAVKRRAIVRARPGPPPDTRPGAKYQLPVRLSPHVLRASSSQGSASARARARTPPRGAAAPLT